MANTKAFKVKNGIDLQAYDKILSSVTADDVFIYDTANDSDGGAWRYRIKNTSWYNEPLNTSTRGSRREFPAVAVLVCEDDELTIYDGDDPDLPMWMVFPADGYINWASSTDSGLSCVHALNGRMFVGNSGGYGNIDVDFIKDYTRLAYDLAYELKYPSVYDRNILESAVIPSYISGGDGWVIANNAVHNIDMTVLPNAPVDPETGLPRPTIVLATQGSVDLLRDDNVTVSTRTCTVGSNYKRVFEIAFTGDNNITFPYDRGYNQYNCLGVFPLALWGGDYSSFDYSSGAITTMVPDSELPAIGIYNNSASASLNCIAANNDKVAVGQAGGVNPGITIFEIDAEALTKYGAYISKDYNTGWLAPGTNLATCSDTTTGDLSVSNEVSNGDFASGITGWDVVYDSSLAYDSGNQRLKVTSTATALYGAATSCSGLTIGKRYFYYATVTTDNPTPALRIQISGIGLISETGQCTVQNTETFIYDYFTATSTAHSIQLLEYSADSTGEIFYADNVGLVELVDDHSKNNTGLTVTGTINRVAVNTGAELVYYSGFSTSDYLKGYPAASSSVTEASLYGWFKHDGTGSTQEFVSVRNSTSNSYYISLMRETSSNDESFGWGIGGANGSATSFPTGATVAEKWYFLCLTFDGTRVKFYTDGEQEWSGADTYSPVTLGTRPYIGVGNLPLSVTGDNFDCALVRFAEHAIPADQVKKIYQDEKLLFEENAAATIYGSSSQPVAVAYDKGTDRLHVGTSQGRSVFQGLRRVDNTADAVGANISASKGFVADD